MEKYFELNVPVFFQGNHKHNAEFMSDGQSHWSITFMLYKALFDFVLSLLALPVIILISIALLILNPWLNPGPLLFVQERLGRNCKPFFVYKFRTMTTTNVDSRSADDGVEHDRITPLGRMMRRTRVDELPNFFNVLRGEMSIIGPRPDAITHARHYLSTIPHYGYRYMVKPGITGLAQIESGYAEGVEATAVKAHYDQLYVERSCGRLDVYIALKTVKVMLTGFGAK